MYDVYLFQLQKMNTLKVAAIDKEEILFI